MKKAITAALLVPVLVCIGCSTSTPPPSQPSPLLAHVLPGFDGKTLGQTPLDTAQGSGRPTVVKFFSSECVRCKTTLEALQRIYEDDADLFVVGVSEDESAEAARRLVDNLGLRFPVMHDPTGQLARKYRVARMPATFVASSNGNVSWVGGPEQTEDAVRAAVSAARD
jgi:peroxiredoxin